MLPKQMIAGHTRERWRIRFTTIPSSDRPIPRPPGADTTDPRGLIPLTAFGAGRVADQERPQSVRLGETPRVQNVNAADLGASEILIKIALLTSNYGRNAANRWN